jgi:hypothetical protein
LTTGGASFIAYISRAVKKKERENEEIFMSSPHLYQAIDCLPFPVFLGGWAELRSLPFLFRRWVPYASSGNDTFA